LERKNYHSNHRRIRSNSHIRELAATVKLSHKSFIQPLFVDEQVTQPTPITSLAGINSDTQESVLKQIEADLNNGISKFMLFPVPATKHTHEFDYSFVLQTIQSIKQHFGNDVWIAADVCLCAYTSHGHCGILNKTGTTVLNDASVKTLADYSLQLALAGADCIAPSDMMDGRIIAIREQLFAHELDDVSIMSYSAKFASAFYGPFRDACHSSPDKAGMLKDRKTYQLSSFNRNDAIQTALRDIEESADIIMVKPSVLYADIIHELSHSIHQPIAAYHVSGEYQSIELLAANGLTDRAKAHTEIWASLTRSGADIIISYAARNAQQWIHQLEM